MAPPWKGGLGAISSWVQIPLPPPICYNNHMKITKYEHACVVIEESGERLVIDPGEFAVSLTDFSNITVVVVTHTHDDHLDVGKINAIIKANPDAKIFTVSDPPEELPAANVVTAIPNTSCQAGGFHLLFSGGKHALVHTSFPIFDNVGVCVNETFYYAGDSFALPAVKPKVLAVPANAPWMKTSEAMDYLAEVKPEIAFPTHNGFLNEAGQRLANSLIGSIASSNKIDYRTLKVGESITV